MYDPTLGRWLEQDPIGFDAGDMNLYRMEGNNPVNEVDPSGEDVDIWFFPKLVWNTGAAFITGEEPPLEYRIMTAVANAALEVSNVPDITQVYKSPARAFWEWLARSQLDAQGRPFAALLFRHSLQDNPSKLVFAETHFGTIAIRNSKAYQDAIAKIVECAEPGKSEGVIYGVDFGGDNDLGVGIGHGNFRYKLIKVDNNNYEIEVQVYDRYNFELHVKDYLNKYLGITANNAAWLSQYYWVINGYDWETVWLKERKGNVL